MFLVCLFLSNFSTHNDDKKHDTDHQSFYLIRYITISNTTKSSDNYKILIHQCHYKEANKEQKFLTLKDFHFNYLKAKTFRLFQNLLEQNSPEFLTIGLFKKKISYLP